MPHDCDCTSREEDREQGGRSAVCMMCLPGALLSCGRTPSLRCWALALHQPPSVFRRDPHQRGFRTESEGMIGGRAQAGGLEKDCPSMGVARCLLACLHAARLLSALRRSVGWEPRKGRLANSEARRGAVARHRRLGYQPSYPAIYRLWADPSLPASSRSLDTRLRSIDRSQNSTQ